MAVSKLIGDKNLEAELKEFLKGDSTATDGTPVTVGAFRPLQRLKQFVANVAVRRAKAAAEKAGKTFDEAGAQALADESVGALGDGTFLEWLRDGGLEMIIKFIMQLLAIFAV